MSVVLRLSRRPAIARLLRVLVSSGAATVADTGVLFGLVHAAGVAPALATVIGALLGGAVNFALTRAWVFDRRGPGWLAQAARYFVVVVGGGALVSAAVVAAALAVGAPLLVAKTLAVVVTLTSWTYPMARRVIVAPRAACPLPAYAPSA